MQDAKKQGWLAKLKHGLSKTTAKITDGLTDIFLKKALTAEALDELEELLITSDVGVVTASFLVSQLKAKKFNKEVSVAEVKEFLAQQIAEILTVPVSEMVTSQQKPYVFLVVGVNGNGKTTTIGKLAEYYKLQHKSVLIAACDTFRAAAVEQLAIWAKRSSAYFESGNEAADPASVAYGAIIKARELKSDVVFVDTAGRMHNKVNLMEELAKIVRVINKVDAASPDQVLIVIDATTGQNALSQIEQFNKIVKIDGIVITKLDGTARAGIVIAIAKKFQIPIRFIGVGEGISDIRPFNPKDFANNLLGVE